jgi:hypothetical protein
MSDTSSIVLFYFVSIPLRLAIAVGSKFVVDHKNDSGALAYGVLSAIFGVLFLLGELCSKENGLFGFPRFMISLPHAIFYIMFSIFILQKDPWAYTILISDVFYSVVFYTWYNFIRNRKK